MGKVAKKEKPFSVEFTLVGDTRQLFVNCFKEIKKKQEETIANLQAHQLSSNIKASVHIAHAKAIIEWSKLFLKKYASDLLTEPIVTIKLKGIDAILFFEAVIDTKFAEMFWLTLTDIHQYLIV